MVLTLINFHCIISIVLEAKYNGRNNNHVEEADYKILAL